MGEHIWIYHFTAIENLPSILSNGLICDSKLESHSYVNSGDPDIKDQRKRKSVPFGGVIADYVPFYFAPRSPMLYRQHHQKAIEQKNIIYLITDIIPHLHNWNNWCCSDRNAAKFDANFYNTLQELKDNIRWDIMNSVMWNDTDEHPNRKALRMAEFLIFAHVNISDIQYIATYNNDTLNKVSVMTSAFPHLQTVCAPQLYFWRRHDYLYMWRYLLL